jgi:hypothetical protein
VYYRLQLKGLIAGARLSKIKLEKMEPTEYSLPSKFEGLTTQTPATLHMQMLKRGWTARDLCEAHNLTACTGGHTHAPSEPEL